MARTSFMHGWPEPGPRHIVMPAVQ